MSKHEALTFKPREFKGSRFRCLVATHPPRDQVAAFLTAIAGGAAVVGPDDTWAPGGFLHPNEAKLNEPNGFLNGADREMLAAWWLAKRRGANTPNWDLVSTADIGGERGVLFVEAKAHAGEFSDDRCGSTNRQNFERIGSALVEATAGLNEIEPGFVLSADHHYQLSNRFAFAWKLGTMGIPVVLVYLGFLNATEMSGRRLLRDHGGWNACVLAGSRGIVPEAAWNRRFEAGPKNTPVHVLLSSADLSIEVSSVTAGESA